MPPAGIVIFGIAISQATLIGLAVSLATTIISGVLQMVLAKKPKTGAAAIENRTITVKQPVSPWQKIVGSARVGGTVVFLERLGTGATADVWIGIVWAAHECKAIDSVYADDEQIFVNVDGSVRGDRSGQLEVYNHLGDPDQTYDTAVAAAFPLKWTEAHRGRGRCYSFFQLIDTGTNWDNAIPNLTADIRGSLLTDSRTGEEAFTDNAVQNLRAFLLDADLGLDEDAIRIDLANFNAESNICDEEVAIPEWSEHWILSVRSNFTVSDLALDQLSLASYPDPTEIFPSAVAIDAGETPGSLFVQTTGTLPSPLVAATEYWVRANSTVIQLFPTEADASANTNRINITSSGSGTHSLLKTNETFEMVGRQQTFTASAATDLLTFANGFSGSTNAKYKVVVESTGTIPPPLVEGTHYRIAANGVTSFIQTYPVGAGNINITGAGSGTHTLRLLAEIAEMTGASTDTANDTLTFASSDTLLPRYNGRQVVIRSLAGTGVPDPFSEGETLYLVNVPGNADLTRLARSRSDADNGVYVDITSIGVGGNLWLESVEVAQEEVLSLTTGMVAQVDVATSGSLPTGLSASTDYNLIRRGRQKFQIASSLENALAGTAIDITNVGSDPNLTYKVTLKRERRFTANGAFNSETDKREVLKWFASAIGMGAILEPLGTTKWRVKCGVYRVPLGELGIGDIRGGGVPEIQTKLPLQDTANTIKGTYNSPLNYDQLSDFPAVSDPALVAKDGGRELVQDIQLPLTNSKEMARRIAKSWLKRKRLQRSIRWPATLPSGFRWEYGDGLCVTFPLMGYDRKTFQVEGWEFKASSEGGGAPIPQIDLTLREMNPMVWR